MNKGFLCLATLSLFLNLLLVRATVFAQDSTIRNLYTELMDDNNADSIGKYTLECSPCTLKEAMQKIESQGPFRFVCRKRLKDAADSISINCHFENASIKKAIRKIFKHQKQFIVWFSEFEIGIRQRPAYKREE